MTTYDKPSVRAFQSHVLNKNSIVLVSVKQIEKARCNRLSILRVEISEAIRTDWSMFMKMFLVLKVVCLLIVVSLYVSITTANVENKRNRQMSAVDDAVYETLVQLTKSEFDVPVKQRSAQQKASCVRFWRNKSKFSIQNVNGGEKAVMKKSELRDVVRKEFKHCKGIGARKLKHRLKKRFEGVSEPQLQHVLSRSKANQKVNARFTNKAISRSIRARAVQVRLHFVITKASYITLETSSFP